ncbi:MAG: hypothetical protein IKR28_05045, partial [Selenomonadaceae bacterium]|nr:hypothetical protein [Selenomonadaceae bacterium]
MTTLAILLFVLSLIAFFFLLFYKLIQEKVMPQSKVRQRMQILQTMDTEVKRETRFRGSVEQQKDRKPLRKLEDIPFVERVVIPAKGWIEGVALQFAPQKIQAFIQHKMVVAGKPANSSVGLFIFKIILLAAVFGGGMFVAMSKGGDLPMVRRISFLVLGVIIGGMLPISTLARQI